jgi:hypothetical protein
MLLAANAVVCDRHTDPATRTSVVLEAMASVCLLQQPELGLGCNHAPDVAAVMLAFFKHKDDVVRMMEDPGVAAALGRLPLSVLLNSFAPLQGLVRDLGEMMNSYLEAADARSIAGLMRLMPVGSLRDAMQSMLAPANKLRVVSEALMRPRNTEREQAEHLDAAVVAVQSLARTLKALALAPESCEGRDAVWLARRLFASFQPFESAAVRAACLLGTQDGAGPIGGHPGMRGARRAAALADAGFLAAFLEEVGTI